MIFDQGEIVLYKTEDGRTNLDVHLREETVWLTQSQMVGLFQKTKQDISLHIRNIFKEAESQEDSVVKEYLTTAADGKQYKTKYYNLDVIISVGYRVKSPHGTQFRIWATSVLKDHLVRGYTLNQRRLAEKGLGEARQMLALLSNTLESHNLVNDEGQAVLHLVEQYARTWRLLWQYDEDSLSLPAKKQEGGVTIQIDVAGKAIATLRQDLIARGEATDIFGNERGDGLAGILGAIRQTFSGRELYPGKFTSLRCSLARHSRAQP